MSLTKGSKPNHTEPRKDPNKKTKGERRLAARIKEYESHGKNPPGSHNPSNAHGPGHDMHKPGSKKK